MQFVGSRSAVLGLVATGMRLVHPKIKSAIQLRTCAEMWALVTPYYPCMWSLEKQPSFAQSTDGGKWTCGLREIGRQRGCSLLLWQQERVPI